MAWNKNKNMIKRVLIFSLIFAGINSVGLYCAMTLDIGRSFLFCTEVDCDFKFPYFLVFLLPLIIFIYKGLMLDVNSKIKASILSLVLGTVIIYLYSFIGTLFYMFELSMGVFSNEFIFQLILFMLRSASLVIMLAIVAKFMNKKV
jgi:hypothetical protein